MKLYQVVRRYLVLLIAGLTINLTSTYASPAQEIDEQVWTPFIQSWKTMDGELNASLHHPDIVRVMGSMNIIEEGQTYLDTTKRMMGMMKKKGITSTIEFHFTHRIHSEQVAWDKGFYRAVMDHPEKGVMNQYAEFSVMLVKEEGKWLIKVDQDNKATEESFNAASTMN